MMNKKEFTKIAKRILHRGHEKQESKSMSPNREWFIGLVVAIAILGGSMFFSHHVYINNKNIVIGDQEAGVEVKVVYREALVKTALENFATRQAKFDSLMSQPSKEPKVEEEVIDDNTATTSEEVTDFSETEETNEDEVLESPEENVELVN